MAIEQTSGVLFQPRELERVADAMRTSRLKCYLETLDARWGALYLPDGALDGPPARGVICALSRTVPLLYFRYSEDYSWRYAVFDGGDEVAVVLEDFQLWGLFAEELARVRGMNRGAFYFEHGDEVHALPAYRAAFRAQFARRNVAAFATFGLREPRRTALEGLLEDGEPDDGWQRVEAFRRLLELETLKHKSYWRYEEDERHRERAVNPSNRFWGGVAAGWLLRLPEPGTP